MTLVLLFLALWTAAQPPASMFQATQSGKQPIPPGSYAGTEACRPCHQDKVDTFLRTAHHLDSQPGDKSAIDADFSPGHNRLNTRDPNTYFTMDARTGGVFVTGTTGAGPAQRTRTERIDLITGSGRKGQTFLFWKNEDLYELPVSVWSAQHAWMNSPGYAPGTMNFERPIPGRCLECHATYFEARPGSFNRFNKDGVILGIECEKCHGPAKAHVAARQGRRPVTAPARDIVNTGKLSRDRQIELCATCHAGGVRPISAAFSYLPGEPMSDYFEPMQVSAALVAEVHGNQVGLMKSSKCYARSDSMTCSTCHNVHTPQRDIAALSTRCQTCHKVEACGFFARAGKKIESRCVDCHMPNRRSNIITLAGPNATLAPDVRTHAIRIYLPESEAVLKTLQ